MFGRYDSTRSDAASEAVSAELARNFSLAQALGFNCTPGWIVGDKWVNGYVGYDRMKATLEEAGPPVGE